jgi:hypothetical protein
MFRQCYIGYCCSYCYCYNYYGKDHARTVKISKTDESKACELDTRAPCVFGSFKGAVSMKIAGKTYSFRDALFCKDIETENYLMSLDETS